MAATIEVFIKDGRITLDVQGVDDASCADLTRALEEALGEVDDIERKPQYYSELEGIEQQIHEE